MVPRRHFYDVSHDPQSSCFTEHPKPKRQKNAHFDHMIQSMSAVNRDRRQRKDAYISFKPTTLASELSFIKRTDTLRVSSASKASSEPSFSHHASNTLPQWLVKTFMTLPKKNPLRLLLPPDTSESLHTETETTAQSTEVSANGPSFALPEPNESEYLISLPQTTPALTDEDQESWRGPLPFSTPGPGSLLGSSVVSNTAISFPVPKKHVSPVFYANNAPLPSNRSHISVSSDFLPSDLTTYYDPCIGAFATDDVSLSPKSIYSSDSLLSDALPSDATTYYDPGIETSATDDVGLINNPSMPEEDSDHQSLSSNIHSTRYCAPRPVHLYEDPMCSNPFQPGYEIDYDAIDFHWEPFDRKNLIVPGHFQNPIYVSGPAHSDLESDTFEYEPAHAANSPVNTETNTLNPHTSPPSPVQSISPNPFRFFLPPEIDTSTLVPESQAVQEPSTPKKSPHFAVPGVYMYRR